MDTRPREETPQIVVPNRHISVDLQPLYMICKHATLILPAFQMAINNNSIGYSHVVEQALFLMPYYLSGDYDTIDNQLQVMCDMINEAMPGTSQLVDNQRFHQDLYNQLFQVMEALVNHCIKVLQPYLPNIRDLAMRDMIDHTSAYDRIIKLTYE